MPENKPTNHQKDVLPRAPIVVVMGHIDHGKTKLLDAIRKTDVVSQESGGITQHIGAYEVERAGKKLIFLDTPGHEAFVEMRSRGVKVADIAILVVAADDGVKPQTKEALSAIVQAEIPYLIAINKIDKLAADVDRVKNELAQEGVFLEGRGGTVPVVEISAKESANIEQLLETVLLLAEMETLRSSPRNFASGVVIESHRDPKRGVTSTLLVLDGTLKKNEYVVAGEAIAKARIMENFRGEAVDAAGASLPVVVVGFDLLPSVGSEFHAYFSQKDAMAVQRTLRERKRAEQLLPAKPKSAEESSGELKEIRVGLIIKSDVEGSAEAIHHEVAKIKGGGFQIKFLKVEAGDVSQDDVSLASSADHAIIVAFKAAINPGVEELAEKEGVRIRQCNIIYEVSDYIKKSIEELLPPEIRRTNVGKAKILKIFKGEERNQIVGGRVTEGILRKDAKFSVVRRGSAVGEGRVENLQSGKIAVSEVALSQDFGAQTRSSVTLVADDVLELFDEEIIKRKL